MIAPLTPLFCVALFVAASAAAWLQLPSNAPADAIAIVPLRFVSAAADVAPVVKRQSRKSACSDPPRMKWAPGECILFELGGGAPRIQIQTEQFTQENGWDLIRTHARVVSNERSSAWQFVAENAGKNIEPMVTIRRDDGRVILWQSREGIGSPSKLTVVFSSVAEGSPMKFGRQYSGGGQPCD